MLLEEPQASHLGGQAAKHHNTTAAASCLRNKPPVLLALPQVARGGGAVQASSVGVQLARYDQQYCLYFVDSCVLMRVLLVVPQVARGAWSVQASCVGVQPAEHHQHSDEQAQAEQAGHTKLRQRLGRPTASLLAVAVAEKDVFIHGMRESTMEGCACRKYAALLEV